MFEHAKFSQIAEKDPYLSQICNSQQLMDTFVAQYNQQKTDFQNEPKVLLYYSQLVQHQQMVELGEFAAMGGN